MKMYQECQAQDPTLPLPADLEDATFDVLVPRAGLVNEPIDLSHKLRHRMYRCFAGIRHHEKLPDQFIYNFGFPVPKKHLSQIDDTTVGDDSRVVHGFGSIAIACLLPHRLILIVALVC